MKKQIIYPVFLAAFTLGFCSCSSSNHVVSKRLFQKRKYTKGWHINKDHSAQVDKEKISPESSEAKISNETYEPSIISLTTTKPRTIQANTIAKLGNFQPTVFSKEKKVRKSPITTTVKATIPEKEIVSREIKPQLDNQIHHLELEQEAEEHAKKSNLFLALSAASFWLFFTPFFGATLALFVIGIVKRRKAKKSQFITSDGRKHLKWGVFWITINIVLWTVLIAMGVYLALLLIAAW